MNNRSFVIVAVVPGLLLSIMLLASSSVLVETYESHSVHQSTDCVTHWPELTTNHFGRPL